MPAPSQPLPTVGQPASTEDPKTRAALLELQTILSAGIDGSNVATSFISTFIRTLLDDADAATARATLGFPVATTWNTFSFANNASDPYGGAAYAKDSMGFVHLRGRVRAQPNTSAAVIVLPAGFRPLTTMTFPTRWWDSSTFGSGEVTVDTAGNVSFQNSNIFGHGFLDGVIFPTV